MKGGANLRSKVNENTEKPRNTKAVFKKLVNYLASYKLTLLFTLVLAAGGAVFSIVGPKLLGNVTNELFTGLMGKFVGGDSGGIDFAKIGGMLLFILGLYITSALFSYILGWMMTGVAQKVTYKLRNEVSAKIHKMPFGYFDSADSKGRGDTISIIINDVDTLSQSLNQSVAQVIQSIIMVVGVIAMMFSIDWIITLISMITLPISFILISVIVKSSQKHFKTQQEYLGKINGQVEEVFGSLNIVSAFNAEEKSLKAFDADNAVLCSSAFKSQAFSGLMMPIMMFIGNLGYVAVAIVGGLFVISGRILPGDIQAFIQYTRHMTHPIGQIAQVSGMIQSTIAAAERVFEFLEETEEIPDIENAVFADNIKGSVEFKNVKFGYSPDKMIINDFSAKIKPGQKIAIVGPTGAGKTTVIKLLMRFYELNGGEILIDGVNIRDYDKASIRAAFGMVLQETWLFNGTILENIKYAREDSTDEEAISAAKAARAHHFIKTLPDGYNMEINEEISNISDGQKQLLTIARAILSNPKILILDEATSSVDTRTEIQIQKAMDALLEGAQARTSFIIAHRLSTIRGADLILVMKDGDIIEQGNHEGLLAQNGFYAELYNSQFA
ncbi:MAG: ABC transporter ATP-binding protein/permease [Oscillospiraceae bacterium]|nr:ABC transporter ATP-binding protein/permease [Oscillospiraceae bacterium]